MTRNCILLGTEVALLTTRFHVCIKQAFYFDMTDGNSPQKMTDRRLNIQGPFTKTKEFTVLLALYIQQNLSDDDREVMTL